MAKIHEEITVVDRFSGTLDKLVNKYDRAYKAIERTSQAERDTSHLDNRLKFYRRLESQMDSLALQEEALANMMDKETNKKAAKALGEELEKIIQKTDTLQARYEALQPQIATDRAADGARKYEAEMEKAARAAEKAARAEERAAEVAANKAARAAEKEAREKERTAKAAMKAAEAAERTNKLTGGPLLKQVARFTAAMFTVRRIISYIRTAVGQLPETVKGPWTDLTNTIKNSFAGGIGAFIQGLTKGLRRLNSALQSPSGQRFLRGMETVLRALGKTVGWVLEKVALLVEWMGDHFEVVATVAGAALVFLTGKMIAFGVATAMANAPLLILAGIAIYVSYQLYKMGFTAEEVFGWIGEKAALLYVFIYNCVIVPIHNKLGFLAEFMENVFVNPKNAVINLFGELADRSLEKIQKLAQGIDAIFGTSLADKVATVRVGLKERLPQNAYKVEPWELLDPEEYMKKGRELGEDFGRSLSFDNLTNALKVPVNSIAESTGNIEKSVSKTEEDIKSLVDLATRKYINNINLTAQTPVINVTGANTGNTPEDRRALAAAIRDIIVEQAASGSVRTTARAF